MKHRKTVSIKDVAKLAGVSPTTVSRVINNSDHPVSSKTRKAVEKAIEELDFEPNRMARGLINSKSHIIGVIVHDIADAYFAEMLKGIQKVLFDYDYIVNIYNTYRDVAKELRAVNVLRANGADAVIFTGGTLLDRYYREKMTKYIEDLKNAGCVVVGVADHPFKIKTIEVGNTLAAQTITTYLLDKGHQRIAFIKGPEILSTSRQRLDGYKKALKNKGIKYQERYIFNGNFTFEDGRKIALQMLDLVGEVTAVIASNDEMALGLMWELRNQGVNVPEEISVTGIDNIPAAKYSYPPLTTISLPIYEIGIKVGKYVLNILEEDSIIEDEIKIQIGLVERSSVQKTG